MPSALESAILQVIVYFDLFFYPLTALEIWKNLREKVGYGEVVAVLQGGYLRQRVTTREGVWFLLGQTQNMGERHRRYRTAKRKINRAGKFARFARRVPGVRAIYACNSLGFLQAQPESDIDLFVTVRRGQLWTARFFLVLLARMFGRPRPGRTRDGICLSFFAVENANMNKVALSGDDVYYAYWQKQLLPLTPHPALSRRERDWGEWIERVVERVLRWMQLKILPAHLKSMANKGVGVVINDEFLKFHDHDKREYFRKEWARRVAAISG